MTTAPGAQPQPPRRGGTPSPPAWSLGKAVAVLAVAVGLGAYLVVLGGGRYAPASGASRAVTSARAPATASSSPTTSPPTTSPPTTSPPASGASTGAHPSPTVKVLVANASQTNGVAGYYSGKLSAEGWGTLAPITAGTAETSSAAYYASGRQQDALAIAASIGIPSSAVQSLTSSVVPVVGATQADVVVVVGNDLAAKVPAGAG